MELDPQQGIMSETPLISAEQCWITPLEDMAHEVQHHETVAKKYISRGLELIFKIKLFQWIYEWCFINESYYEYTIKSGSHHRVFIRCFPWTNLWANFIPHCKFPNAIKPNKDPAWPASYLIPACSSQVSSTWKLYSVLRQWFSTFSIAVPLLDSSPAPAI